MNDTTGKSSSIFTPSGCLGEDALMRVVNGTMSGKQLELANKHIQNCPFCADAAEGLRLWMAENKQQETLQSNTKPDTGNGEYSGKMVLNQEKFHVRTTAIKQRIRQRLSAHSRMEDAEGKRLQYKPFVWMAAAASIVLLIGSFIVVWVQNRHDEQKLAALRARELQRIESASKTDTLSITFPEGNIQLANASIPAGRKTVYENSLYTDDVMVLSSEDLPSYTNQAEMPPEVAESEIVVTGISADSQDVEVAEANKTEEKIVVLALGVQREKKETVESKSLPDVSVDTKKSIIKSGKSKMEADAKDNNVSIIVEQMPMFPGGEKAMNEFIAENLRFPASATESGISGKVFASFIVRTDGSITDIQILKGLSKDIDNEVVRVISMMPRWKAGEQNGKKLDVKYNIPINISLQH